MKQEMKFTTDSQRLKAKKLRSDIERRSLNVSHSIEGYRYDDALRFMKNLERLINQYLDLPRNLKRPTENEINGIG